MTDDQRAKAREAAMTFIEPFFWQIRLGMAEERRKGTSESEIQRKINLVVDEVERKQRGKIDDEIVDEMIALLREAATPPDTGPASVQ